MQMPHFKVLQLGNIMFMMKIMVNWTFMLKGSIKLNLSGAKISYILKSKMSQFISHKSFK
jgi:hypothetical protein